MFNSMYKYRHVHAHSPNPDWLMSVPWIRYATYIGDIETLIIWPRNDKDIQTFKNVSMETIVQIRTQLRQVNGWYIEAQVDDSLVWNFLGVYDEKLQRK